MTYYKKKDNGADMNNEPNNTNTNANNETWCSCMRIYESICGKCTGYGSIINCSGADPISGSTLPLESAQAVTT